MERRRAYKELESAVNAALFRHDPMGLAYAGVPADEYDVETSTILPRLGSAQSADDVGRILEEEFERWFDEVLAGDPRISAAAEEIWKAWEASDLHRAFQTNDS